MDAAIAHHLIRRNPATMLFMVRRTAVVHSWSEGTF